MTSISAIIRIISGLALIILAYTTYQGTIADAAPGAQLTLFGNATVFSRGQLTLGFVVIGFIGTGLITLGALGLARSRR